MLKMNKLICKLAPEIDFLLLLVSFRIVEAANIYVAELSLDTVSRQ